VLLVTGVRFAAANLCWALGVSVLAKSAPTTQLGEGLLIFCPLAFGEVSMADGLECVLKNVWADGGFGLT
jgi:hypothetical protein